jgi:hypothetical protein
MVDGDAPEDAQAVTFDTSVAAIMDIFLSNDQPLRVMREGAQIGVITPQRAGGRSGDQFDHRRRLRQGRRRQVDHRRSTWRWRCRGWG